jgi:mannose-6-phosphate isomerase-like protein (cupin superfamily)
MADRAPLAFNLKDARTRPMRWDRGTQLRLFGEETGAQNVDVHINILNVDSGPGPYHYHERAENVYIVLEGTIEAVVEGKRFYLTKDDVAFIPPGLRHYAGNGGTVPAKAIEIYAPAGADFHIVDDPDPATIEDVYPVPQAPRP